MFDSLVAASKMAGRSWIPMRYSSRFITYCLFPFRYTVPYRKHWWPRRGRPRRWYVHLSNLHSVDAGHSVWTTHRLPRYFYFNGNSLPNILISQRGTRWIRTRLHCTVMHLLKNLWVPSSGWRDLCSATLLLIGEFREVQHVWGKLCPLPASSFVFSLLS